MSTDTEQRLERYAELLVKSGVNLQTKQTLVITAPIECLDFVRTLTRVAFAEGARDVVVSWRDDIISRTRFLMACDDLFDEFPDWQRQLYQSYADKGAAFLRLDASDPEIMADVDSTRITRSQRAGSLALAEYRDRLMSNHNAWCVAAMPSPGWAKKVFPDSPVSEAESLLLEAILRSVRIDCENPIGEWENHKKRLRNRLAYLNTFRFDSLEISSSLGTKLRIGLPTGHKWVGGSEFTSDGVEFIANMPTEEVFTAPHRLRVDGVAVSSMPFVYNGNLISGIRLVIREGRVVESYAEQGRQLLENLLLTDAGSSYIGEVALVPYDSPISRENFVFFNTLFDENAACHLALGKAYPVCVDGGSAMSRSELDSRGINESLIHEDFMIGTSDMEIYGITSEGQSLQIFADGNFVGVE